MHIPVLVDEVVKYLQPQSSGIYVDATVGCGGHAKKILENSPGCRLVGLDVDRDALRCAAENLKIFGDRVRLFNTNYLRLPEVLAGEKIDKVSGILADFGFSSLQIDNISRGFGFKSSSPLDMRMDRTNPLTAAFVVNSFPEEKLADIFYEYGQERFSRKIARRIVQVRKDKAIRTTRDLADIVVSSYPRGHRRIHPATKVFQALRIYVNNELENIKKFMAIVPGLLADGGRVVAISYHSGEDRIVKKSFLSGAREGYYEILTKKPIVPGEKEVEKNFRSRSAKLRCAQKIRV